MENKHSILIADDNPDVLSALKLALKSENYHVATASSPQEVLTLLSRKLFSCLLLDLNYQQDTTSGAEGKALIQSIRELDKNVPIIAMTGFSSVEIAVEMMKQGANDYIEKPWRNSQLFSRIATQIEQANVRNQNNKLTQENALLKKQSAKHFIAQSQIMKDTLEQIERIAKSDMNVLFTGENGTGKSALAKYLHEHSMRNENTFLAVNMGAIPETLFESEMFGHVKGAFTDAKEDRMGRFELASEGTLFLDEIANINMTQQAKLLHVLEERKFERIGSQITLDANVRMISATNADLTSMVEESRFRQDLLYRLNTIEIRIPALRERPEDILPIATFFIESLCQKYRMETKSLSEGARDALLNYQWPGNIRELMHTIERSLFLAKSEVIAVNDLNLPISVQQSNTDRTEQTLEEIEKSEILKRLAKYENDPQKTAASLGLTRSSYYRRLEKHQLNG